MKKTKIISILILIILIIGIIQITQNKTNLKKEYTYTKAICNTSNYCEDYLIECNENNIPKITPTGFSIQQNKEWKDSRIDEKLCQ